MSLLQAIILGIVQGLTEFLPISSSGHLLLIPNIFDWPEQSVEFDAVMHLATLVAVLVFFRSELNKIFKSIITKSPANKEFRRLGWIILVATIPALIFGLIIKLLPENPFRTTTMVILSLFAWAIVMFVIDMILRIPKNIKAVEKINWKQGIYIGLAQAIALIPGTSRSGITMITGLAQGIDRPTAARFSFLLGIPAIAAAGSISLIDILTNTHADFNYLALLCGFIAAFISGFFAIKFLIKFLEKHGLGVFVLYRILLGLILIMLFW